MSALPKAVQKHVDEANRLFEEMSRPTSPPAEVKPAEGAAEPQAQTADQSQGQPQTPPSAQAPTPAPTPAPTVEAWEQKYRVLQGKYNAEVPRLQTQLRETLAKVDSLQQQVIATQGLMASFSQRGGVAAPGQTPAPAGPATLVKDDEINDYGRDLYDFIQRAAKQAVLPEVESRIRPVTQQVEQISNQAQSVAKQTAQTAQERVFTALASAVPNWEQVDTDERFHEWLDQVDPYSGARRGELLKQAYQRHDAPRVVAFFKGFLNENAVVQPTPAPTPPPQAAPAQGSQRSLDQFIAPGTVRPGTTGAPNEAGKRTWTQAEIKQFYDDCAAGKYVKNPQRRNEIERDIFTAQIEGRIR
jgi:hypothetical protein